MMKVMTFRAPERYFDLLMKEAKRHGYTRNSLILQIIRAWAKSNGLLDEAS